MAKRKAIVIGSGIGGSGIALLLQHSGKYDVDLYEKNNLTGGRFASYYRDGFRLDIGCHLVANCDKGTMGKILDIAGRPEAVKWKYSTKPGPVFNYKGQRVKFPQEIYKMGFSQDELQKIMQFYTDMHSIPRAQLDDYDKINMAEMLGRYVASGKARAIFGLMAGVYFVIPDNVTPVAEWIRCNHDFSGNKSSGYPVGGTGAVPEAYTKLLQEFGGRLHLNKGIKRIIIENKTAKGVELSDGSVAAADIVISNAGLKPTVSKLAGREHYSPEFFQKTDSYRYSESTLQLKVALDSQVIHNENMVMFLNNDMTSASFADLKNPEIPEVATHGIIPIVSNMDPACAPEGRQLVNIGGGVYTFPFDSPPEVWKKWEAAYLNALELIYPGIKKHVLWTDVTTPGDINKLFGEDGNVIGIAQSTDQVGQNRPKIADPEIAGLYHCSADTGLHGIGGELAADSALRLYEMLA